MKIRRTVPVMFSGLRLVMQLGFRNLWRNPKRSFLTLLAIVFGISVTLCLASLSRGIAQSMIDSALLELNGEVQIHPAGYADDPLASNNIPLELIARLRNNPPSAWARLFSSWDVYPVISVPGVISSERDTVGLTLMNISSEGAPLWRSVSIVEGSVDEPGVIIGEKLARRLETAVGRRVVVMATDAAGRLAERGVRIAGIYSSLPKSRETRFAFWESQSLMQFLDMRAVSYLAFKDGMDLLPNHDLVTGTVEFAGRKLYARSWEELAPLASSIISFQSIFLYLWFSFIVFAVVMGVTNTMFMAVYERASEFTLLNALGTGRGTVFLMLFFESLWLLLLGCSVGAFLGYKLTSLLAGGVDLSMFARGTEKFGIPAVVLPQIYFADYLVLVLMTLISGLAISAWVSLTAVKK